MSENDQILTNDQTILVQYLASGKSVAESARIMGIADKTARRWLKLPHVKAALAQATGQMIQDVKTKVAQHFEQMTDKALETIKELVEQTDTPHAVRLKASQLVLDRVAPLTQADPGEQSDQALDASLMAFMTDDEIAQLEEIVSRARQRKEDAESNITPFRKSS